MKIKCEVISDKGLVRDNNEDIALLFGEQVRDGSMSITCDIEPLSRFSAIVADGMGGLENGEVASQMAVTAFDSFLQELPEGLDYNDLVIKLKEWARGASQAIIDASSGAGMGCTFCGMFTYKGEPYIINIGDSRTYRLRYDFLKQITTDHSERNRLQNNQIPSNIIYNALGIPNTFIDVIKTKWVTNDKYIVCSDGLNDMVDDVIIEGIMRSENSSARQLIEAACNAGGQDNITVIYLEVIEA